MAGAQNSDVGSLKNMKNINLSFLHVPLVPVG